MARASTRSQKAPAASQSQPRGSQSQRTRRGRSDESDDDGEGGAGDYEADGDAGEMDVDEGETEIKRKANELVRLALFTEHKRTPLRREEISKKVLGTSTRAFNRVFDRAQDILQKTFGMELIELPSRAGLDADTNPIEDELNEARKATGMKKKAAATGSKSYILCSVLHPAIIEYAALTDEQILEEEAADVPSDDDNDDDDYVPQYYGSIISWSSADQLGSIGILYTILALILVNGRVISDSELRAHLKRLGLPPNGTLPLSRSSTHKTLPFETYLTTLIRQGYIDRLQVGDTKAGGKGTKRGRVPTHADDDSGATYEWRWGARAGSEVGEKAIAKFIAEFMVGDAGADEDDEEEGGRGRGRERREGAEEKLARMMKGIERAAGGHLAEIR